MPRLKNILRKVERGELSADKAALMLGEAETELGFARVDIHRERRRGLPEVVYCPGKTPEQIVKIMSALRSAGQNAFATRATPGQYAEVKAAFPDAVYHEAARAITADTAPLPRKEGLVAVVTAGTSDVPVAEEAALAAERVGARVAKLYDVGVAGIHRLVRHMDVLRKARVIVVAAGMEGALPSVVGGLTDKPVVAVPTSSGYGTGQGGLAALLAMLNSCVPGVVVVNIDNGFGAGVAAGLMNRAGARRTARASRRSPAQR